MACRLEKWEKLPVCQRPWNFSSWPGVITEALKEDEMKAGLVGGILGNMATVRAKIAGAEGRGLYSLRMQNAVVIKIAVQDMFNAVSFASIVEINEDDYVQLMREKVDEFRLAFIDWVRSFDKNYDIPDN